MTKLFRNLILVVFLTSTIAHADKVCIRYNTKKKTLQKKVKATGNCPRGFLEVINTALLVGPSGAAGSNGANGTNGADGSDGADGAVRVWGDGSAGNLTINSSGSYSSTNPQFQNFEIATGSTLSIASGITIRATGTCTINGVLSVFSGTSGGLVRPGTVATNVPARIEANPGIAYRGAGTGEYGSNANNLLGGSRGEGFVEGEARTLIRLTRTSIGSGGASAASTLPGGGGGGGIALYCKGGITIGASGGISAVGGNSSAGGGGGSGGLIILASETSIVNAGTITAEGGDGGESNIAYGAGGGGGGGVINVLAPVITIGTTNVTGGSAGSNATNVTNLVRFGGSGGGALGGNGGNGGDVLSNDTASAATAGQGGYVTQSLVDPTSLLM